MAYTLDQIKSAYASPNAGLAGSPEDAIISSTNGLVQKYFNKQMPGENWDMNAEGWNKNFNSYVTTGKTLGSGTNAIRNSIFDNALAEAQGQTANVTSANTQVLDHPIATPGGNLGNTSPTGAAPAGWDAQTYANFKTTNPNLEPNAEDTARMQSVGATPTVNIASVPIGLANAPKTQPTYSATYTGGSIVDFLGANKQDSSFAARAKLAAAQGITNYTGTAQQNTQLLGALRGATSPTPAGTPPTPSSGLTVDSMGKTSGITTPGVTGNTGASDANALVLGANASIADIMKSLSTPATPAEQKQQTLLDQMASLVGAEANKAADQLTAEQSAGLPNLQKQFSDINGQILTKTAEYNALKADQEGKPVTMSSILGATAQIERVKASEIGMLTATSQALQGQITTAQNTANRAIDLKYSTIEAQLNTYKAQLEALAPELTKEEAAVAQAKTVFINQQMQAIADAKQSAKDVSAAVNEAISKGGLTDTNIIAKAQASGSVAEANKILAPYLAKQGNLDIQLKQAEISKEKAAAAKAWADTSANTPTLPPLDKNSQSILAQTGISSTIFNYITQGTSALTRLTAAQRADVQKQADAFLNKNGLDYSTFQSRYKAYNDVLQTNLERSNQTSNFAGEVSGTVDQFIKDFNPADVKSGFFGLGSNKLSTQNIIDLATGKQVNNPLATKYSFDIHTMANDLAGYFAASRGAKTPENADLADAANIIAEGINTGSAQALKDSITANEAKVTGVVNKAVETANKNVWKLFGVDQNYDVSHQGFSLPQSSTASTSGTTYSGFSLPN